METFAKLFERFLVFVYHCFDRIVIQGYLQLDRNSYCVGGYRRIVEFCITYLCRKIAGAQQNFHSARKYCRQVYAALALVA